MDDNDTKSLNISNNNDGNFLISTTSKIDSSSSIENINIVTNQGGNIQLGSIQDNLGFDNAENLKNLILNASNSGNIEVGPLGLVNIIQDFQNLDLVTTGADIKIGSIKADKVGSFNFSILAILN